METLYDLPNGDRVWVLDTTTAAGFLGAMLRRFGEGDQEPLFYGDEARPQGVVISFEQWAEYETLRAAAELEDRALETTRERLANAGPADYVPFDDLVREYGWKDPEAPGPGSDEPDAPGSTPGQI